jgi:hypothetical protein
MKVAENIKAKSGFLEKDVTTNIMKYMKNIEISIPTKK